MVFFFVVQKCHEKRRKINSWTTGIEEKPGFPLFPLPLFVAIFFVHCQANVLMPHFWLVSLFASQSKRNQMQTKMRTTVSS